MSPCCSHLQSTLDRLLSSYLSEVKGTYPLSFVEFTSGVYLDLREERLSREHIDNLS